MATYTSTTFANNQPKGVHAGNMSISGQLAWGAASSVGDVGFLCKLPAGAMVVDVITDHTTGATAQGLSYGLASGGPAGSATFSCFIASGAQATINRRTVLGGVSVVSLSANDPTGYGIFACKVDSGTATTSLFVNFTIIYRMDGPSV
jgi:hypothetical protein